MVKVLFVFFSSYPLSHVFFCCYAEQNVSDQRMFQQNVLFSSKKNDEISKEE